MDIRELTKDELELIWTIDRSETVDGIYHHAGDKLVLKTGHWDVRGWSASVRALQSALLEECLDQGGTFYGAFEDDQLIGVAVLESRFIGRGKDQLQLKFLHVSRRNRNDGVGSRLFQKTVERARDLGARRLYISATPSENTVDFYLGLGCRVTNEVDPDLFDLEPEDIHLEFEVPRSNGE